MPTIYDDVEQDARDEYAHRPWEVAERRVYVDEDSWLWKKKQARKLAFERECSSAGVGDDSDEADWDRREGEG